MQRGGRQLVRNPHTYLPRTIISTQIVGTEIARARRERRLTQADLAQRAGISQSTLRSVEQGSPTVAIGIVFELASLLGLDLVADPAALPALRSQATDRLRLLPSRVRDRGPVDDNF
jgi:transcriptional regulator with XRE-family HTH domain